MEWLPGRYGSFVKELAGEPPMQVVTKKHVKVVLEVFEHGILKRRVLEGQTEQDEDWKTGHPLVFPGMLRVGIGSASTWAVRISASSCCAGCTSSRWSGSRLARILSARTATPAATAASSCRWNGRRSVGPTRSLPFT